MPSFPVVLKHPKTGALTIVYRNRVEDYKLTERLSRADLAEDWSPYREVEKFEMNNFRRVRGK